MKRTIKPRRTRGHASMNISLINMSFLFLFYALIGFVKWWVLIEKELWKIVNNNDIRIIEYYLRMGYMKINFIDKLHKNALIL